MRWQTLGPACSLAAIGSVTATALLSDPATAPRNTILATTLASGAVVGVWLCVLRRVRDRLRSLVESIKRLDDGDLSTEIDTNSRWYLSPLADTLERLRSNLLAARDREHERQMLRETLASMEQILGVIGHELRTPLGAIRAMSEFLLTDEASELDESAMFIHNIHDESVRMAELLNNLLDAVRLNRGCMSWTWTSVKLVDVCEGAFDVIRPLVDHGRLSLAYEVDAPDLVMNGDLDAIRRLLINFMTNSVKNTADGSIQVMVDQLIIKGERHVRMCIRDTGVGISEKMARKLGEAFVLNAGLLGSDYVKGSGLGLSICKGIVAAHGGRISVVTQPSEGAEFTVLMRADLEGPVSLEQEAAIELGRVAA